jgi:hypothetical protein
MNEETIMVATTSDSRTLKTRSELHRPRRAAATIAFGVLATTLIASSAIPAFAGKPHREGHDARTEQQSPDVDAESKRKGNKNKSKTVKKSFANDSTIAIPGDTNQSSGIARPYPSAIARVWP